jgi:DNA replication protein DnaC
MRRHRDLDESRVGSDVVRLMRAAFGAGRCPIYLHGVAGCGKSYTAALVYARWGGTVTFLRYCDLISDAIECEKTGEIVRTRDDGASVEMSKSQYWSWLRNVGLLIVDDVGTGSSHEWRKELFWKVLEERAQKPLLLTGNLSMNGIREMFDGSIVSRLSAGTIIEISGQDQRRNGIASRLHRVQL